MFPIVRILKNILFDVKYIILIFFTSIFRHEAMFDLIALMNSLTDIKGNILIPGIMDDVLPVTPEEEKLYDAIDFHCVRIVL